MLWKESQITIDLPEALLYDGIDVNSNYKILLEDFIPYIIAWCDEYCDNKTNKRLERVYSSYRFNPYISELELDGIVL